MSGKQAKRGIHSIGDLLAYASAMESEAVERYEELAGQMEVHHNHDAAQFFRRMAAIEALHVDRLAVISSDRSLPHIAPWDFDWDEPESPEAIDSGSPDLHYLATAYHATGLALAAEQRAVAFYTRVAATAAEAEIKAMAERFADEEREHVRLLAERLAKTPRPDAGWQDDPDPPNAQE